MESNLAAMHTDKTSITVENKCGGNDSKSQAQQWLRVDLEHHED